MRKALPAVVLLLLALAGASTRSSHAITQATTVTFDTPGTSTWTVPAGVAQVTFDVYGAEGSVGEDGPAGGRGGRATATVAVTAGQEFQINVGAAGGITAGGFNGGGAGAVGHIKDGGGGGGGSDVRTGAAPYGLEDRIIVAGGGGGASASGRDGGHGGAGGGTVGSPGVNGEAGGGGGGTQSGAGAGGAGGPGDENGENGSAGQGGRGGGSANDGGGGGGGGYYGGGGGGGGDNVGGGGGGGSGFGPAGVVFQTGVQTGHGKVVITYDFVMPDPIVVTTTDDELTSDGDCSLREAITAANTDLPVDDCGAGSGPDNVSVPAGTYNLALPGAGEDAAATGDLDITADLTISGADAPTTIVDGADLDRVFHVVAGTVEISGVTIRNGSSLGEGSRGGGILNRGTLTLTGTTISGNSAGQSGGGIDNFGPLTINSSTVSGNTVGGQGAGIGNYSSLVLNNSTVSGNTGAIQGGGIFHQNVSGLTLTNSTVTGNSGHPSFGGGGIYNFGSVSAKNTIVANNTASQCFAGTSSGGHNLSSDSSCGFTASGDLQNTDPLLGPLADNGGPTQTHGLLSGSPAIDGGSGDCPPPTTDQRGVARPQRAACDIGSFELEPFAPDPIVVTTSADELNSDGDCSLREAIRAANADATVDACGAGSGPDNVSVPAGTYTLGIAGAGENAAGTGDLDITADLAISGAGAATTIIDGADLDRVFHVVGGTADLSDVTVQNGTAGSAGSSFFGGGILNNSTLTLHNSTVNGNTAMFRGGGIGSDSGMVTLNNSTVSGNTADVGGGVSGGTVVLNNSVVSGNTAAAGGGISGGTVTLNGSTVNGNSGSAVGGGIINNGSLTVTNSTVSGNSSSNGGGIRNDFGAATLIVNNSTVTGNSNAGLSIGAGAVTVKNTIISGNGPTNCTGAVTSAGHNLSGDSSCGFTASGDLQNTDPLLGPLADNGGPTRTHALLSGSPAIDAGSGDCPPPGTDQRGVTRPQGADCDIGAYELEQTCYLDGATLQVALPEDGNTSLVRNGTGIVVTGAGACFGSPTVNNVQAIVVEGAAGEETLTIDLSAGPFAPGAPGGETGGLEEIEWDVDLGAGSDELVVVGSSGADTIRLGSLGVNLNTDNDADVVLVGAELVTVNGGTGADVINGLGAAGNDPGRWPGVLHLNGEGGQDKLNGGLADDVLDGGLGADTLTALKVADGADEYLGGAGTDTISYASRDLGVSVTLDVTANDGSPGEGDDVRDVETLIGGKGNDVLDAGDLSIKNTLRGGTGDDDLFGGPNGDNLIGEAGADDLFGEAGKDTLNAQDGVTGNDTLDGGTEFDTCKRDAGDSVLNCEA